jgi:anti-anti-sigma factor
MKLKVVTAGKSAEVRIHGALTIGSPVEDLKRSVSSLLRRGIRSIRLDLSRVPWADGSGLGALVACRLSARSSGGALTIDRATGKMRELLEMTCLESGSRRRSAPHAARITAHVA